MKHRQTGLNQEVSAAKSGISSRSGRRIEKHVSTAKNPHDWGGKNSKTHPSYPNAPIAARTPNCRSPFTLRIKPEKTRHAPYYSQSNPNS